MKMILTILALLIFSISLNANPPDSCLWAPTPVQLNSTLHGRINNSDSTLYIDTCGIYLIEPSAYTDSLGNHTNNPSLFINTTYIQHKRYYSKSVWFIKFNLTNFAFDTVNKDLNTFSYFTIDDLDTMNTEIFEGFQNIKSNYGNIKFWPSRDSSLTIKQAFASNPYNGYFYLETENLVNSVEFAEFIDKIPNVSGDFGSEIVYPVSVVNENNSNINIALFPNPVKNILDLKLLPSTNLDKITIYNLNGLKVLECKYAEQINVSELQPGIYFLRCDDKTYKFIKQN